MDAAHTPYADARPGRLASTIRTDSPDGCRVAILGLPDDTGVTMNGGRPGAKAGPRAFREALCRYGSSWFAGDGHSKPQDLSRIGIFDAGDIAPAPGALLEETHDRVTARVAEVLDEGLFPICIGGGHDLTWPLVRAVAERHASIEGIYFDAHLDVREEPGSGMPFRKILSETNCRRLTAIGIDPFSNTREHVEWFEKNGGRFAGYLDAVKGLKLKWSAFCSFDLDSIGAADAPGVSAANPVSRLPTAMADECVRQLGANEHLVAFDIMELNPTYDIDGRTARLAARLFLSFLAGFAQRPST